MSWSWLRGGLFPLAVLAFSSVGVDYLGSVFTLETRWLFLVVLVGSLIPRGDIFMAFRTRFAPILFVYLLWCFITAAWSSVPVLSLLKALALASVTLVFLGSGYAWAKRREGGAILYLLPVTGLALFAGILHRTSAYTPTAGLLLYQGITGNPNYLGLISAAALPVPIWLAFTFRRSGSSPYLRLACWAAIVTLIVFLWRADSRASILCALAIAASFTLVLGRGQRFSIAVITGTVIAAIAIAAPQVEKGVEQRIIYKNVVGTDITLSREEPWDVSWRAAKQGGVLGLGYGISAGYTNYSGGLTANMYGREKGNSQLAVWEETGLVGLALYALLLLVLIWDLIGGFAAVADPEERVEIALLIGLIVGLLVQSVFEAWWTAPGSVESGLFWSAVGVVSGLLQSQSKTESNSATEGVAFRPFAERVIPLAQLFSRDAR